MSPAPWLVELEQSLAEDTGTDNLATALVVFASVAGADVPIEREQIRAAARRAAFLLAAGGDPERGLRLQVQGLPHASEAVHGLIDAPDVAWRAYAAGLLAEELGG